MCHQNQQSGFFKVWTFFSYFDRDFRELKQNNKLDTDQLFYYILNIQKMYYQNQANYFFKGWTFFKCFDRDLITCSRHQSLQKFEFELTKSFVMIFLMILQQTI